METADYIQIKSTIKSFMKIDLENYKEEQMKRRLDSWLIRSHLSTWKEYFSLLSNDNSEVERFRNYLTINVTEFFRDLNRWEHVRSDILPYLLKNPTGRSGGKMKIWSAGCSTGAEPYTLAMLMEESASSQKYSILATDLDRGALLKARAGGPYTQEDIRNLTPLQRQSHITPQAPYFVSEGLRKNVTFQEQNLLEDRFDTAFDLIVCRNVVIYFTTASKEMLYEKFSNALTPGGVLFVGGTEIISTPGKFNLQNFGISFYKRP